MTTTSSLATARLSSRILPAFAALVFGLGLYLGTGFAWPSALHNAAHDARHATGFPCH
ncbi:CbtB domain-containing protein [Bauldia litoralis]|uniref:Cobalt transporter subunit CbtB n=1 Tax=Bauldia litoralis TaxID=665467 RepID=A0A1G6DA67_9HYPH|nr:CbtB domain-containing protein [Bauldia litoralis]SDB41969.1 cobalt transporter subunit CbtB [Bauldia litoralis]